MCGIRTRSSRLHLQISKKINDGNPHAVTGDLTTIMAGLACGEPSTISWEILRDHCEAYVSCSDDMAALGMRVLGNPLGKDPRVISGESGAVGAGFIKVLMEDESYYDLKHHLGLNEESIVLLISTEGDTDPVHYRKVVWDL